MTDDSWSPAVRGLAPARLRRFAAALHELGDTRDIDESLQLMVELAVELVDGVDFADIMFVRSGRITTPVSTDHAAAEVDQLQQDAGEGPCLSAMRDEEVVAAADLEREERWPVFTAAALDLGVRSVVAYRLFRERDDRFGALNMFGRQPGLDDADVELGGAFAAYCSAALSAAIQHDGLLQALEARDMIGQAKGILMERHRLTADDAYAMLRRASNDTNTKLRDLVRTVTETGSLP